MKSSYIIREYREEDFDAVTILWRIASEKSLPDFQREKGHFFYEDRDFFRDHILKNNQVWVVEMEARPVAFLAMENDFIDRCYGSFCDHGVWANRCFPRRDVSHKDSIYVHVIALSYR